MGDESFDLLSDQPLASPWRALLILVGLAAVAGAILLGINEMVTLGTSYAHDSSPTPEFRAAGDSTMMLAFVLAVFGATCIFCRRAKHLLMVGAAAVALLLFAGIAAWREQARRAAEPKPHVTTVPKEAPPIGPVENSD